MIRTKRIYDAYDAEADGYRVLVDRLWPRGISKANAHIDLWLRDVAPSGELRKWFGHDPERWTEFCSRYAAELAVQPEALSRLRAASSAHPVLTLLFAAKDSEHNNAVALRSLLEEGE